MSPGHFVFAISLLEFFECVSSGIKLPRIHGGAVANDLDFPWTVSLQYFHQHRCGGSILNRRTILTAAHCVKHFPAHTLTVRVGSNARSWGGQVIAVQNSTYHEKFDDKTFDYDVGVLRLAADIAITDKAQPIVPSTTDEDVHDGDLGYITGWGVLEDDSLPEFLQFLVVRVCGQSMCSKLLEETVTERMLCAGAPEAQKNSCRGDSGGPLVVNGKLVGISSWGPECGDPLKPDVYTRVSLLLPWVMDYLNLFGEELK